MELRASAFIFTIGFILSGAFLADTESRAANDSQNMQIGIVDPCVNPENQSSPYCVEKRCKDLNAEVRTAIKELGETCGKAGETNIKSCIKYAKTYLCSKEDKFSEDDDAEDTPRSRRAIKNSQHNCEAQVMNGKDHRDLEDKLTENIKKARKEQTDLQRDATKFNEQMAKDKSKLRSDQLQAAKRFRERAAEQQADETRQAQQSRAQQNAVDDQIAKAKAGKFPLEQQIADIAKRQRAELGDDRLVNPEKYCTAQAKAQMLADKDACNMIGGLGCQMQNLLARKRDYVLCVDSAKADKSGVLARYRSERAQLQAGIADADRQIASLQVEKNQLANETRAMRAQQARQTQQDNEGFQQEQQEYKNQIDALEETQKKENDRFSADLETAAKNVKAYESKLSKMKEAPHGEDAPNLVPSKVENLQSTAASMYAVDVCRPALAEILSRGDRERSTLRAAFSPETFDRFTDAQIQTQSAQRSANLNSSVRQSSSISGGAR
ncbi:MAG: hypothetical protein C5B49_00875 [Bdellovibrio sp.]|nr:MAG: hypothetical protein C5B49_00875 [Bdellovibrio sp.]